MHKGVFIFACLALFSLPAFSDTPTIYFQSHRGGMNEVPENTLTALRHSWSIKGAVPEVDLRTTSDGVIVCIHDSTPERTTDASAALSKKAIKDIPLETVRSWDAGSYFDAQYKGEQVPTLDEVIALMKAAPDRELYLDLKAVDLEQLVKVIQREQIEDRIIFVHGSPIMCRKLQGLYPGARTMTWLSGEPEKIRKRFEGLKEKGFEGISQLQFHLKSETTSPKIRYVFDTDYLKVAIAATQAHDVDFQLRPFDFNAVSLRYLIDLGVHWYVSDDPKAFAEDIQEALALEASPK